MLVVPDPAQRVVTGGRALDPPGARRCCGRCRAWCRGRCRAWCRGRCRPPCAHPRGPARRNGRGVRSRPAGRARGGRPDLQRVRGDQRHLAAVRPARPDARQRPRRRPGVDHARIRGSAAPARRPPRPAARRSAGSRSTWCCAGRSARRWRSWPCARGRTVRAVTAAVLQPASGAGLTAALVVDKLGALGGTPFHLGAIDTAGIAAGLHLPVGELKELRRAVVAQLDRGGVQGRSRIAATGLPRCAPRLRRSIDPVDHRSHRRTDRPPRSYALVAAAGRAAVPRPTRSSTRCSTPAPPRSSSTGWSWSAWRARSLRARRRGARVGVATLRVQKPGEERVDQHLARLAPDHVLVRSWGSLACFREPLARRPARAPRRLLAQRHQLDHRRLGARPRPHHADRRARPRSRSAVRPARPRAGAAGSPSPSTTTSRRSTPSTACTRTCCRPGATSGPAAGRASTTRSRCAIGSASSTRWWSTSAAATPCSTPRPRAPRAWSPSSWRAACGGSGSSSSASRPRRPPACTTAYVQLAAGTIAPREVVRRAAVHEQFGVTRGTMRTLTVLR